MGIEGGDSREGAASRALVRASAVAGVLLCLAACGGSDPCVEGATLPCDCRLGDACFTGAQVCAGGSFGACQCEAPTGDAGAGTCSAPADAGLDAGDASVPDAGGCMEGASETRASSTCGEETRTCTSGAWSDWTETTSSPAGIECRLGEAQFANRDGCDGQEVRWRRCGSDCRWETAVTECGEGCDGTRRTTPPDQEEICVPAGSFVVGCDDPYDGITQHEDCYPRHEVYLSAFYIDRHIVSVTRYQQCVDAGACTPLEPYNYRASYYDPDSGGNAVYRFDDAMLLGLEFDLREPEVWSATHDQAEAFCAWDGASLVTGAQWERAATGIYERARWPFTDDLSLTSLGDWCRHGGRRSQECNRGSRVLPLMLPNSHWETGINYLESSMGVSNLYHYFEWTSDTMAPYTPTPAAGPIPVDPQILGGPGFEMRGSVLDVDGSNFTISPVTSFRELWHRNGTNYDFDEATNANWGDPNHAAFRCARPAHGMRETR